MKNKKKIIIITITLILLLSMLTVVTAGSPATQNKEIPDNLVQGNVNSNGILWIVSYDTPQGSQYLQPFQSIHANNLTLTIYSPINHSITNNITVLSFIPESVNMNGTTKNIISDPEYENQSISVTPRTVFSYDLHIPQTSGKREVKITWDNTSVSYFITTYKAAILPYSDNPLAIVAIIGGIMLIFTAISMGISKAIINKAKFMPPISQRAWGVVMMITLVGTYELIETYYYDMTGVNWGLIFIPLFLFDFLEILSVYPSKTELDALIQIKDSTANEIETGIYSIRVATMNEAEKMKYSQIENQWGKEYIEERSYKDFVKRLLNIRVPIKMEVEENPDKMQNVKSLKPEKPSKRIMWTMKDRPSKEHPYSEAVLINPLKPSPALKFIEVPTGKLDKEGLPKTKKTLILESHLDGKHMKEAEDFLSEYIASSEAGFVIHRLTKQNALLKSEASQKGYEFRDEIFDDIWEGTKTTDRKNKEPEKKEEEEEK